MSKARVLHVIVQPILVMDDGEELSPGPQFKPVIVRLAELDTIRAEIAEAVEAMNTQPAEGDA